MAVVFSEYQVEALGTPPQPQLHLVERPRRRVRPTPAVYRRRRLAVAVLAVAVFAVLFVLAGAIGRLGGTPLDSPESAELSLVSSDKTSYVIQPGDTWWEIGRALQPEGDIRPLVYQLSRLHKGVLQPGQRIYLPAN